MDIKKLDSWAEQLLDTGKRNNLVNFKDTKSSSVEVVLPEISSIFEKADSSASFEVFDPKFDTDEDDVEDSVQLINKIRLWLLSADFLYRLASLFMQQSYR